VAKQLGTMTHGLYSWLKRYGASHIFRKLNEVMIRLRFPSLKWVESLGQVDFLMMRKVFVIVAPRLARWNVGETFPMLGIRLVSIVGPDVEDFLILR